MVIYEYPNYKTFPVMLIISKKTSIALSTCSKHWKAAHPAVKHLMAEADTDGLQPLHIAAAGGSLDLNPWMPMTDPHGAAI